MYVQGPTKDLLILNSILPKEMGTVAGTASKGSAEQALLLYRK